MCTVGSQEDEKPLSEIATMAHPSDNCAIATSSLRQGTRFSWRGISVEKFGMQKVGPKFFLISCDSQPRLCSQTLPHYSGGPSFCN